MLHVIRRHFLQLFPPDSANAVKMLFPASFHFLTRRFQVAPSCQVRPYLGAAVVSAPPPPRLDLLLGWFDGRRVRAMGHRVRAIGHRMRTKWRHHGVHRGAPGRRRRHPIASHQQICNRSIMRRGYRIPFVIQGVTVSSDSQLCTTDFY